MEFCEAEGLIEGAFLARTHNAAAIAAFRTLDESKCQSYLQLIPFHRFPAAHSCARRFFVWKGVSSDEIGHFALWS
jgi:hypothetical protein